jgi:hypothetical protein
MKSATYGWIFANSFKSEFRQAMLFTDSCDFVVAGRPAWGKAPLCLEYFRYTICQTCLYSGLLTQNIADKQLRKTADLKRVYILANPNITSNYPRFTETKIYSRNPRADMPEENRIPGRNWRVFAIDIYENDLVKIEYDFKVRLRA